MSQGAALWAQLTLPSAPTCPPSRPAGIKANLKDGVLRLSIPKAELPQPKAVAIAVDDGPAPAPAPAEPLPEAAAPVDEAPASEGDAPKEE